MRAAASRTYCMHGGVVDDAMSVHMDLHMEIGKRNINMYNALTTYVT